MSVHAKKELPFKVPTIQLEDNEKAVLDLIHDFTGHLATTRTDLPSVECRVAGGWVRDKLLGMACEDLDICISSLTGHHFATLLENYLQTVHAEKQSDNKKHGRSRSSSSASSASSKSSNVLTKTKIAKIQANPDQSKHLETARMYVLGMEVDLVQLRSEEYASGTGEESEGGSRIPTAIKFGTPLEDALRRDITINTLFYNVHTREVEDWTEKGLTDLLSPSPLIRTPLEPLQTFLDDPLRILRCIRFASRFGFPLDESIKPAVENDRVKRALLNKVSKERIGVELEKMLKGSDPLLSLQLICHLSLYHDIFSPPPSAQDSSPLPADAPEQALKGCEISKQILDGTLVIPENLRKALNNPLARRRLWLALYLRPLRGLTFVEKKKQLPLTDATIRYSVKLSGGDRAFVQHIHNASVKLSSSEVTRLQETKGTEQERSTIGFLLRDTDVHEPHDELDWRLSMMYALITELASSTVSSQQLITQYSSLVNRIEELKLDSKAFQKSILDGQEVLTLLGLKPGPLTASLIQKVLEWQLNHPEGSKDECRQYMLGEWQAGSIEAPAPPTVERAGKKKGKAQK